MVLTLFINHKNLMENHMVLMLYDFDLKILSFYQVLSLDSSKVLIQDYYLLLLAIKEFLKV